MMNLEVSKEDLAFIKMLVSKADVETAVEIHHARSFEYKDYLKSRSKQLDALLVRISLVHSDPQDTNGPMCVRVSSHQIY